MRERILWVGIVLLVLGMTLTILSYANLYYWEKEHRGPLILTIDANSSSDYMLLTGKTPDMKKLEVKIYWFPRLDILNRTLNYSYPDLPYTVTLYEGIGLQSISKTFDWRISPTTYVFDIPDDWKFLYKTTVFNYDDHPICLVQEITLPRQTLNSNMQTVMNIGIASTAFGILLISARTLLLLPMGKQAPDTSIGAPTAKRRGLKLGVPMAQGRIKLYVESMKVLVGIHSAEPVDRTSEWKGTLPEYDFVLPEDQGMVVGIVRESCKQYGFELTVVDVTQQDAFHRLISEMFGGIREFPTIVSGSSRRIEGKMSKDQVDAFLSKEKQTWI